MITRAAISRKNGFTLLELVIAIGLLTMLVGMVMGTANSSLQLGNLVVKTQNEEMLHQAFIEFLDQRLTSLPGNTRFEVEVDGNSAQQYLSTLTLQKVPLGFSWGGGERIAKAVQLATVRRRSGFLDIVLSYYENEVLEDSAATGTSSGALSKEPFAQVTLLEDVQYFEWRFLDGQSMEWRYDWDLQGRLPIQIELVLAFGAQGSEIRQVFWLPTKVNPEILMREMQQTGGGGTQAPAPVTPPIVIPP